jgi:hypothetical protein
MLIGLSIAYSMWAERCCRWKKIYGTLEIIFPPALISLLLSDEFKMTRLGLRSVIDFRWLLQAKFRRLYGSDGSEC